MARIVIVSNRVPIPKSRVPAAGGLTVALRDLLIPGSMWFGWSGRLASEPSLQPALVEARGVTYATVDLTAEAHRAFYVGFANGALWPLLHFRLGLMHYRREDYLGYLSVNQTFATALGQVLQPDDTVWAHDYHLLPLGRMLRQQGFTGPLGFFLHVPFVPPSMLEAIPVAREMVADLCAYDVVGFQTEEHARDFRDCAQRLLGAMVDGEWVRLNGRRMRAFADPIGIDAQAFAEEAERSANDKLVQRVAGQPGPAACSPSASTAWTIPRACPTASRPTAACSSAIPSTAAASTSCRSARARARRSTNIAACAPSSTG